MTNQKLLSQVLGAKVCEMSLFLKILTNCPPPPPTPSSSRAHIFMASSGQTMKSKTVDKNITVVLENYIIFEFDKSGHDLKLQNSVCA